MIYYTVTPDGWFHPGSVMLWAMAAFASLSVVVVGICLQQESKIAWGIPLLVVAWTVFLQVYPDAPQNESLLNQATVCRIVRNQHYGR